MTGLQPCTALLDQQIEPHRATQPALGTRDDPAMARHRKSGTSTGDWTDYNVSDPGVTLLQVLAYTAEALLVVAVVRKLRSSRGCRHNG